MRSPARAPALPRTTNRPPAIPASSPASGAAKRSPALPKISSRPPRIADPACGPAEPWIVSRPPPMLPAGLRADVADHPDLPVRQPGADAVEARAAPVEDDVAEIAAGHPENIADGRGALARRPSLTASIARLSSPASRAGVSGDRSSRSGGSAIRVKVSAFTAAAPSDGSGICRACRRNCRR